MIGEYINWKRFLITGFRIRIIIAFIVVLLAELLKFATPNLLPVLLILFFIAIELFVFIPLRIFMKIIITNLIILHKKDITWKKPPKNLLVLANKMGIKIKKFGIRKNLYNAYVTPNNIVILGEKLKKHFNNKIIEAVMAHEFAHIKRHHNIVIAILICLLSIPILLPTKLPSSIYLLSEIAYLYIVVIFVMHYREYDADKIAAKYIGVKNLKNALNSLYPLSEHDIESETHPSIKKRIRRLLKSF